MNTPAPRPLHVFALQALVLTLLLGFWPTPRQLYLPAFHAQANQVFAWFAPPHVELGVASADLPADTRVHGAASEGGEPLWQSWFDVMRVGYWPSAVLVALLLATPLPARRRAVAVVAGLLAVHLFTLARISVEVAYANYELAHGPGGAARGVVHLLLRAGSESLTATIPSGAFVFACWVWLGRPRESLDLSVARRVLRIPSPGGKPER